MQAQSIGPNFDKTGAERSELKEIVSFGEKGFISIVTDNGENPKVFSIRYFDAEEKLVEERQVVLSEEGLPAQIEGAFRWGNRLTVLSSLYYPGPKRNNLLLRQYSIPQLEEVDAKLIDEAYTPPNLLIPFGYSLSPDSTQLLCYGWSYSLPEDPARIALHVFDEKLNSLWEKNYILPYKNENFYLYGSLLDPSGHVYILCEDYGGSISAMGNINENKIKQVILYAGEEVDRPREYVIQTGKLTLSGVRFALASSGRLEGAGFYREGNKSRYEGLITISIDGAANKMDHLLTPIDKDLYKEAATLPDGYRPGNANRYNFADYTVDYLFLTDHIHYLVAEQIIEDAGSYNPLEFNDIFIARIRGGRYLDWIRRLPKRQKGSYDDLPRFSYNAFFVDDRLLLIYNNMGEGNNAALGYTELATVTASGDVKREDITKLIRTQSPMVPLPALSWDLHGKKLALFGREPLEQKAMLINVPWEVLISGEKN